MEASFIKKIVSVTELEKISKDISEIYKDDNLKYGHALGLSHDIDLITRSLSHESLLTWNFHIWAHFNGEKWDSLFIGIIRKSEKFNKKIMDEYLWMSKNSLKGIKLLNMAIDFAKKQGCEYFFSNVIENHPKSNELKSFYKKFGFEKDTECYVKKI